MEIIHATCVAYEGKGVLLRGPSGSGKSDLALRLIDRGALLVADDLVAVRAGGDGVLAGPPPGVETWRGVLEVRGIGLLEVPGAPEATVALVVDLGAEPERLPQAATQALDGQAVRTIALKAAEASAVAKIVAALTCRRVDA